MKSFFLHLSIRLRALPKYYLYLALFLITTFSAFLFFSRSTAVKSPISFQDGYSLPDQSDSTAYPTPDPTKNTLTIMLLGYGGPGHQGGFLADVMMLAHFDFDQSKLTFISIPRDVWYQNYKLNSLLGISDGKLSPDRLQTALSSITDLPIDYFIGIDFVGFERLIGENLGSITVDVPEYFEDNWYPIRGEELNPCGHSPEEIAQLTANLSGFALEKEFPCRYETIIYKPGPNQMEGGDALKYVRSRHSSSDFSRSQRQKVVLLAIRDKLFSLKWFSDLDRLYAAIVKNVTTNFSLESVRLLVPLLQTAPAMTVNSMTLSTDNVFTTSTGSSGQFILVPKESWDAVRSYVQSQL